MRPSILHLRLVLALILLASPAFARADGALDWRQAAPLPDALGLAMPFAGISANQLIVAGGANFPNGMPWDGGKKVWHDAVYVLNTRVGQWRPAGQLPRPLAYGVSLSTPDGLLCAGGSDSERHFADVFMISLVGEDLRIQPMPALPVPLANAAGALAGTKVFLCGGSEAPGEMDASNRLFTLDLAASQPEWRELEPCPGRPRFLAAAGAIDGSFHLIGGVGLKSAGDRPAREYLADHWRYRPGEGWQRLADLPRPIAAAATPAPAMGQAHLLIIGGDDGSHFGHQPPQAHPGFGREVLAYHTITNTWAPLGQLPFAQVTVPSVQWGNAIIIPSGEIRPGVRSPAVWIGQPQRQRATFGWKAYLTLSLYPLIMLGIAWRVGRKSTADDFFRAQQRIPWWAAGLSIYATLLSSITFMAIPSKAYATDWSFFLVNMSVPILAPLIIAVYLPFYRQLDVTSAYEYLEKRFNLAARWLGSFCFIILQLGRTAIVLYLPALALSTVSNFDMTSSIVIMGVICIIMTFQGGLESVVWTDVAQTIILLAGAVTALAVAVHGAGGWGQVWTIAHADNKLFGGLKWSADLTSATIWVIVIGNLFTTLGSYTASQDVVQRFVCTKDTRQAARSIWTNAIMVIPSTLLFFAVGTALYAFYKVHPGRLDPALRNDAVFPLFIVNELPAVLGGLVVAGIFAAAQPTSSLNSIATAYVTDFHARLRPATTDAGRLRLAKWITALSGAVGTAAALVMSRYDITSAWDAFLGLLGLTGSALAGLFALGIFSRRAHGRGAILGAACAIAALILVQRYTRLHFFTYGAIGVLITVIAGWLFSLVIPSSGKPIDGLTIHTLHRSKA